MNFNSNITSEENLNKKNKMKPHELFKNLFKAFGSEQLKGIFKIFSIKINF